MYRIGKRIAALFLGACLITGPSALAASDDVLGTEIPLADEQAEAAESEITAQTEPEEDELASSEEDQREAESPAPAASEPRVQVTAQGYNSADGIMEILVSGVPAGTSTVLAAWPDGSPDYVREFPVYGSSGSIRIFRVGIADFGLREGWYTFEARSGGNALGSTSASMYFRHGTLTAGPEDDTESAYRFQLENAVIPSDPAVWFLITDTSSGRRSIRKGVSEDDRIFCTIPASRLSCTGTYKVAALAAASGATVTLGQSEFEIHGLSSSSLAITDMDGSTGSFAVRLEADAPSGIESAVITVWSQDDESDRYELEAVREDGDFIVRTSISEFGDEFGLYHARAEVLMGNGIRINAGETEAEIAPRNYITAERNSDGILISVLGPDPADASAFTFEIWRDGASEAAAELSGSMSDDGTVFAVLKPRTLDSGAGTYTADVLAGGTKVGSASFELVESDFLSKAEARIAAGCQRVYDEVGTDLHDNYMWVVKNFSYIRRYGHLTPPAGYTRAQWYAVEGLENQSGNCYTFAAAFCELAKGLGYNARYVEAEVWGPTKGWQPHGIVLVYRNGGTYICDPELQFASSKGRNLYMQPASSPKATYRW